MRVTAVYWANLLFSQRKTTGSRRIPAKFIASWKVPLLIAPSPKKQSVTSDVLRKAAASAAPVASPRPPPTMPLAPSMPSEKSAMCIEPPRPAQVPFALP
jgi:hypothetical protein